MSFRKPEDKNTSGICDRCGTRPRAKQQGGHLSHCWRCRTEIKKERQPLRYQFNILRKSAKRRNIPFRITFKEWCWWCNQTGYMDKKGRGKGNMSVGRIDHSKGYSISNIQMEEYHFNTVKGHEVPGKDLKQNHSEGYDDNEPF